VNACSYRGGCLGYCVRTCRCFRSNGCGGASGRQQVQGGRPDLRRVGRQRRQQVRQHRGQRRRCHGLLGRGLLGCGGEVALQQLQAPHLRMAPQHS